ncbi:MAG TPA: TatD family hydrolase [Acidimicrobiales bacterium]|nr:TatD family hydrolase [Acidimicrobiales bacterium]
MTGAGARGGLGRLFGRHRRPAAGEEAEEAAPSEPVDERDLELARLTLWTDSHCHIQYADDDAEAAAVVDRAVEVGVRRMICIGTDVHSSRRALEIARSRSRSGALRVEIYSTVGLHPHDARHGTEAISALLAELASSGTHLPVVGVGECGLDYHYDHSPRSVQRSAFAAQVALANEHGLTLVIHTREAFDDTLSILASEGTPARTVFHCFTGGPAEAERCLEVGAFLSFSGIVTFNNASEVREAARACPVDRLLVETDSPYLTPVPYRGRTNEPSYVPLVGEAVAREKGLSAKEVATLTSTNAVVAFGLPALPG